MDYKVVIVGAGPAGIFAALTLADLGINGIILLEQGKDLSKRERQNPEDRLCGWGGAGAFSDGKLTLSTEVGGVLREFIEEGPLYELLKNTDEIYAANGAPDRIFGKSSQQLEKLADRARLADLELLPTRIRHIGTENCRAVLERFKKSLSGRVDIHTESEVQELIADHTRIQGVKLADGRSITSKFVIVAPGRSGARWMKKQAESLGLRTRATSVDIR
jgi:hypothetical protein